MTLIDIAEIHPPRAGGKVSRIVAESGERYEIWPDKLDGFTVGRSYMVEIREREYQGRTISSITKIAPAPQVLAPAPTIAAPASPSTGEAQYVGRVIAALIAKGDLDKNGIAAATHWLRQLWRQNEPLQRRG